MMMGPYESLQTAQTGRLRRAELLREAEKQRALGRLPGRRGMGENWRRTAGGPNFARVLWLYMMLVLLHWTEHVLQIYQIYVLGWLPTEAGGLLGEWFPQLNSSEVLHLSYNLLMWGGIVLLIGGMAAGARRWWRPALWLQSWHLLEHLLLQWQWLTGVYFFGAARQMSIGELLLPRAELHFLYNLVVVAPLVVGLVAHRTAHQAAKQAAGEPQTAETPEPVEGMMERMAGKEERHALPQAQPACRI